MPSPAAFTIYAFGITAFLAGISSLASSFLSSSSESDFPLTLCLPQTRGNALAAVAMGLYYTLAAYQENSAFFIATVPMRLLTTAVFSSQGWTAPAVWEGSGAAITGVTLLLARGKAGNEGKKKER